MTDKPTLIDEVALRLRLKRLIIESLHLEGLTPDDIADDGLLFGGGLGLDSVDALELVVALEQEYGIQIQSHDVDKSVFASVANLAAFVAGNLARENPGAAVDGQ